MEKPKCPACGTEIVDFIANPRGQLMGKCKVKDCKLFRKWRNLDRPDSGAAQKAASEKEASKAGSKEASSTKRAAPTARGAGKRKSKSRTGRGAGEPEPAGQGSRHIPKSPATRSALSQLASAARKFLDL